MSGVLHRLVGKHMRVKSLRSVYGSIVSGFKGQVRETSFIYSRVAGELCGTQTMRSLRVHNSTKIIQKTKNMASRAVFSRRAWDDAR